MFYRCTGCALSSRAPRLAYLLLLRSIAVLPWTRPASDNASRPRFRRMRVLSTSRCNMHRTGTYLRPCYRRTETIQHHSRLGASRSDSVRIPSTPRELRAARDRCCPGCRSSALIPNGSRTTTWSVMPRRYASRTKSRLHKQNMAQLSLPLHFALKMEPYSLGPAQEVHDELQLVSDIGIKV